MPDEKLTPRLISKEEQRTYLWCDECGIQVKQKPWPDGWCGCSISAWLLVRETKKATTMAHWCPRHPDGYAKRPYPDERELRHIRDEMLANEALVTRWSARREGLAPMPMGTE